MPLLRYNVAMSLDGFIARADGSYDWLPADPGVDFVALFAEFDHFIMGRRTFEVVQALGEQDPTRGRSILVASHTLPHSELPGVQVVGTGLAERLQALKAGPGKDLWLFGGASLFRALLDQGLVDRVEVSVIPILLGGGIRLIPEGCSHPLQLVHHEALSNGILQLVYKVG
ncbi:MAG: dihydrofolate reductase family protein [Geothrix sp.]|uniref:dihydrofolate reductase family protein n=1 Tax=Geothrix sp. TaxID=1962974 RepID=UPI003BB1CCF7